MSATSTAVNRPKFDQQAAHYDTATPIQSVAAQVLAAEIAKHATQTGRWLDVGCGTGKLSLAVAACLAANAELTAGATRLTELIGVDSAPAMVECWHTNCRTDLPASVSLLPCLADMTALPLGDQSVDTIMSSFALHWVAPQVLFEFGRVLKLGGQLHLAIPVAGSLSELTQRFTQLPVYPFLPAGAWQTQLDALVTARQGRYLYQSTQDLGHEYANLASLLHALKKMGGAVTPKRPIETATLRNYLQDKSPIALNYRLLVVGVAL